MGGGGVLIVVCVECIISKNVPNILSTQLTYITLILKTYKLYKSRAYGRAVVLDCTGT